MSALKCLAEAIVQSQNIKDFLGEKVASGEIYSYDVYLTVVDNYTTLHVLINEIGHIETMNIEYEVGVIDGNSL